MGAESIFTSVSPQVAANTLLTEGLNAQTMDAVSANLLAIDGFMPNEDASDLAKTLQTFQNGELNPKQRDLFTQQVASYIKAIPPEVWTQYRLMTGTLQLGKTRFNPRFDPKQISKSKPTEQIIHDGRVGVDRPSVMQASSSKTPPGGTLHPINISHGQKAANDSEGGEVKNMTEHKARPVYYSGSNTGYVYFSLRRDFGGSINTEVMCYLWFDAEGQWAGFDLHLDTIDFDDENGKKIDLDFNIMSNIALHSSGIYAQLDGSLLKIRFTKKDTPIKSRPTMAILDLVTNGQILGVEFSDFELDMSGMSKRTAHVNIVKE